MKREIFEAELEKITGISKAFGARKVVLFGSCLHDLNNARDIDIAVSGIQPEKFFEFYGKVSMEVEDEVDIVDLDDLREHMRETILSQCKVIYE